MTRILQFIFKYTVLLPITVFLYLLVSLSKGDDSYFDNDYSDD